jgi:hypothetical protein
MNVPRICTLLAIVAAGLLLSLAPARAPADANAPGVGRRMTVHEWGTFTALQAEDGRAIAGINTDDEPLPPFVHDLHNLLVSPSEVPSVYFKGAPRVHPDVIVRLETPVIYFYPPAGAKLPASVDVDVAFRGGWLTQFYPDARAAVPGLENGRFEFGPLGKATVGSLAWHDLRVGGEANGPETTSPVWLAPRNVKSASVKAEGGETERYLFYRGVGHINAPLAVHRSASGDRLEVRSQYADDVRLQPEFAAGPLWLVDVRGDGSIAFTTVDRADLAAPKDRAIATFPADFSARDYSTENLKRVRESLHAALVRDGLYGDEADGLLNTWEASYFRRPGLRLFFLVPRQWTDHVLPLRVSGSADTTRVMVGRIEIVTPRQRDLLRQIARGPVSDSAWVQEAMKKAAGGREDFYREEWYQKLMNGERSLTSLNVEIPNDYRAYLSLGRFRNALILDEQQRHPSATLAKFIEAYDLEAAHVRENKP